MPSDLPAAVDLCCPHCEHDESEQPIRHDMPCPEYDPQATYAMVAPIIAEIWPELGRKLAPPDLTVEVILTVPKALGCPACGAVRWHVDTDPEVSGLVLTCLECGDQTNTNELLETVQAAKRVPGSRGDRDAEGNTREGVRLSAGCDRHCLIPELSRKGPGPRDRGLSASWRECGKPGGRRTPGGTA